MNEYDPLEELVTPPRNVRRRRPRFGASALTDPVELPSEDSTATLELHWSSLDLGLEVVVRRLCDELVAHVRLAGPIEPGVAVGIGMFGPQTRCTLVKTISLTNDAGVWVGQGSLGKLRELRQSLGERMGVLGFLKEPVAIRPEPDGTSVPDQEPKPMVVKVPGNQRDPFKSQQAK